MAFWGLLCHAAEAPASVEEPQALARRRTDLSLSEDPSGDPAVGFTSDGLVHALRRARPCPAAQARWVEALLLSLGAEHEGGRRGNGPVARYAARALPLHAAHAGVLPGSVLENGSVLAICAPNGLYETLRVAYPDGVPTVRLETYGVGRPVPERGSGTPLANRLVELAARGDLRNRDDGRRQSRERR
ncbi:hypothetical protein GCM10023220_42580 [Streptomyces ziwulingensis]|uniref:Uncharacterized protein n=1 Tax=Streptomyces ziwulingensis TaxID=1045501 RepID=A0ABP9CC90_9ACTN